METTANAGLVGKVRVLPGGCGWAPFATLHLSVTALRFLRSQQRAVGRLETDAAMLADMAVDDDNLQAVVERLRSQFRLVRCGGLVSFPLVSRQSQRPYESGKDSLRFSLIAVPLQSHSPSLCAYQSVCIFRSLASFLVFLSFLSSYSSAPISRYSNLFDQTPRLEPSIFSSLTF